MFVIKYVFAAVAAFSAPFLTKIQRAMNLGIRWAVKDPAGGSFKSWKRRLHFSAAFEGAFKMGQP